MSDVSGVPPSRGAFEEYWESFDSKEVHQSKDPSTGKITYRFDFPKGVDILDLSFAKFDPKTGCLDGIGPQGDDAGTPWTSDMIQSFVNQAHQAGIKVKIAVGGATYPYGQFNPQDFAHGVASFVSQYHFDGVDFDWEDLRGTDPKNVGDMIHLTREALGSEALITMTVEAPAAQTTEYYNPIFKIAGDDINNINIMAYDAFPGYNPQYDIEGGVDPKTGINYGEGWLKSTGFPIEKFSLGFYPRDQGAPITDPDYVKEQATWAKSQGMSVFMWDYNEDHEGINSVQTADYFTNQIDDIMHGS